MATKPYRILSIDGGGVRGLIAAIWLNRLEQKLGHPLRSSFDLIAGTSTGSIIACALSMGMTTEAIVNFYLTRSREVFPRGASRLWNRFQRVFSEGLDAPRYDGKGLETVLQEVFKNIKFGDLQVKPTLITSYDTLNREALVFKNDRPEYNAIPVWEICKASSSAPVYFPAHLLTIDGQTIPVIDGGVVANNPTACAIAEAFRMNRSRPIGERIDLDDFLDNLVVASFGTGEATRPIPAKEAQEWGALEWITPLISVLFDGSADAVDYIAKYTIVEGNYFRLQTPLTRGYDDLDNADSTNLSGLTLTAQEYLRTQGDTILDRLITKIRA